MPRFFFDVVEGAEVTEDAQGLEFADVQAAIGEAVKGARDLVAHGIMENADLSGHSFRIRDSHGNTVATVSFRETLPGRLKG